MGRNTTCTIIVGAQRTGKTTFAKKLADEYLKKVLVVCPDDMEPAWYKYKLISPNDIIGLKSGRSRVIYDPRDTNFLRTIVDNYKGGLLIWDDAKVYFNTHARVFELEAMLARRRQFNLDIMFMYHGFSTIPALLWTYSTHLALFRTNDAFQRSANKTLNYDEMVKFLDEIKSRAQTDPHVHKIISLT